MKTILILLFVLPLMSVAQDSTKTESGRFSLGVRSTISLFNDEGSGIGQGAGGQFRIQLNKRLNTEWFADYITSGIGNYATRRDGHIGWSVMFYMSKNPNTVHRLSPYLLAGHCFDYTKVLENSNPANAMSRWSSAVQMGIGTHYNFTDRFDISFNAQYMIHLGKEIKAQNQGYFQEFSRPPVIITKSNSGAGLEGHLLLTTSFNYRIADFNKKK
jgi:hypothetical protein